MTSNQLLHVNSIYAANSSINEEVFVDISHELRTPLTAIQVALDLLICGKLGTLSKQEYRMVEIAANNAERLMRLTNAIEGDSGDTSIFLSEKELAQLRLERDIELALARNEFTLCYQPIVSFEKNQIIGFEALIRWEHPHLGTISPQQFIPLAEASGLIIKIGRWVLETACAQLRSWQKELPENYNSLTVSVNVSSKQLADAELVSQIQQILQKTGLAPECLVLEITESAIIDNQIMVQERLTNLQNLGIRLHIDDFGTGYSSLSRLYELPLNAIKIDRSFVKKIDCLNGTYIIEAIINLAHNLGMEIIAEGIETSEQFFKLQALGCNKGQGYFLAKPLHNHAIAALFGGKANFF